MRLTRTVPTRTVPTRRRSALLGSVLVATVVAATLMLVPATAQAAPDRPGATSSAAAPDRRWPGHPGRTLVHYRVRKGDTATGIATRFHAWTAELLRINHRSAGAVWRVGEQITVPVVSARAAADRGEHRRTSSRSSHSGRHPGKARVRDEVVRVANAHGMWPKLALAIAWQESGWQQDVTSSAGAIGTMQVMPGNRAYLSRVVGRELRLRKLHDNVTAGVVLFRLLRADHRVKRSVAGYYQGIGSLRAHGRYPSTKAYIANVLAHWSRLRHGWDPLK